MAFARKQKRDNAWEWHILVYTKGFLASFCIRGHIDDDIRDNPFWGWGFNSRPEGQRRKNAL